MATDVTKFPKFDELTAILERHVAAHPNLARLDSMGKSYEGRNIWVLTVTNQETGADTDKPAFYIDGNIHAGEVTGCNVVLHTIDVLLDGYGKDDEVTALLDQFTFYLAPRVQPDGAELYLTTPTMLRSSVRGWPHAEEDDGLVPEDIDGDGKILQMRIPDPKGEWSISDKDPRLMVKRGPDQISGEFFRVVTEGNLKDHVRGPFKLARSRYGLDQNRNFPANWTPWQAGGGPFPLSEPETRAVATFVAGHKNIVLLQTYHTTGGVILRPPCAVDESAMAKGDVAVYKVMGEIGEAVTGYPCASVYAAFPGTDAQGRRTQSGAFMDWAYDHMGILAFATELWDIASRAGLERKKDDPMRTVGEDTEDDGLALLAFNDKELGGRGFIEWKPFDHPQLGTVDIGGWDFKQVRQNAPAEFLQDECERNAAFTIRQATMLPKLAIRDVEVEQVTDGIHIVRATVENTGFLPTFGSGQAQRNNLVEPISVELTGGEVLLGKPKLPIGHLQGRVSSLGRFFSWGMQKIDNERLLEWLVRGDGPVTITATSDKAGTVRHEVQLT